MPGVGPATLPQYFLNPRHSQSVLCAEFLHYLFCSEFRMPLPDRAYPDSFGGEFIEMPPYLLMHRSTPGGGHTTLPQ